MKRLICSLALGAGFLLLLPPEPGHGQVPDSLRTLPSVSKADSAEVEVAPGGISPRGAFIRSGLIPGWGHAEVGALVRGAFYFSTEATAGLMIMKTQTRLARTRKQLELRESAVTARLAAQGTTNPGAIETALAADPVVEDLRALEETRTGQREDWIAFGLFFMLIGGVDAYVSAHLANFPTAVVIEPTPAGGMEIGFSLPFNF